MGTEIKVWDIINDDTLTANDSQMENVGKKEGELEKWIRSNPEILGDDILLIGEQVETEAGPLDFLGIDGAGNTVIIELKRGEARRDALAQAIDYASAISSWGYEELDEVYKKYKKDKSLDDLINEDFFEDEDISFNQVQRILLVGDSIDEGLQRMIEWVVDKYEMNINFVIFRYIQTQEHKDQLLARTMIIPEEEEQEKIRKKQGKRPDFSVRIKNAVKEGKLKKGDVFVLDIEKSNLDDDSRKKLNDKIATEGDRFVKIELTGIDNRLHVVKWLYDGKTYAIDSVGWEILKWLALPGGYHTNLLYSWKKEGGNEYISDLIS